MGSTRSRYKTILGQPLILGPNGKKVAKFQFFGHNFLRNFSELFAEFEGNVALDMTYDLVHQE